jgi:DNA (cytosine-5)-methyltransferase 1
MSYNSVMPRRKLNGVKVVDLFSGIGGLSHGFVRQGFEVVAGIDIDGDCKHAYETNNNATFLQKDIASVTAAELKKLYAGARVKVLVGCAPCQPFSTLNRTRSMYKAEDERWKPLTKFLELIIAIRPEIVSMENVKELADEKKYPVFGEFVSQLRDNGYEVSYAVVDASRYGVPQTRRRLVLLASRLGKIELIPETHDETNRPTVRAAIGDLPRLKDGSSDPNDAFHRASKLSAANKKRIDATPRNGGSAKSWSRNLLPDCYKTEKKNTYKASVYGRMRWDTPGPTVTTHCITLGTGRHGHPSQNRAMSIREAARLQTFPDDYSFAATDAFSMTKLARFIGNAVPVKLGEVIAQSIRQHIEAFNAK